MYTSVRRYQVQGSAVAVGRRIEQELVPLVAQSPGFHSFAVLDEGEGLLVTITAFADQSGADAAERRASDWFADHLAAFVTPVDRTGGGVLVHAGL